MLVASVGAVSAMTVPASSSHRWCAERSDVGFESPSANVSFVLGVGIRHEAEMPNAFACWSNSANAEVLRAWADPETVRAGAECVPMPGSRVRVRCPRQLLASPVDDDGRRFVDTRHAAADTAADATADATSKAIELGVSAPRLCVAHEAASRCTDKGVRATAGVTHDAQVATGEEECRMQPGRRCLVGGARRDPAVETAPGAEADVDTDDQGAAPTTVSSPEIPESE